MVSHIRGTWRWPKEPLGAAASSKRPGNRAGHISACQDLLVTKRSPAPQKNPNKVRTWLRAQHICKHLWKVYLRTAQQMSALQAATLPHPPQRPQRFGAPAESKAQNLGWELHSSPQVRQLNPPNCCEEPPSTPSVPQAGQPRPCLLPPPWLHQHLPLPLLSPGQNPSGSLCTVRPLTTVFFPPLCPLR